MTNSYFAGSIALASTLVLSACGGGTTDADADGDGEVTASEMQAAVESGLGDMRPEAGQYRSTIELVEIDIPGAPQEMRDMMGSVMNTTTEFCLTPEEADKGFEEALTEGQQEGCTISKFEQSGSTVDMAMSCDQEGMGQISMTMTGEVAPNSADMQMSMEGTNPQLGEMSMKMNFKQERIGDCAE